MQARSSGVFKNLSCVSKKCWMFSVLYISPSTSVFFFTLKRLSSSSLGFWSRQHLWKMVRPTLSFVERSFKMDCLSMSFPELIICISFFIRLFSVFFFSISFAKAILSLLSCSEKRLKTAWCSCSFKTSSISSLLCLFELLDYLRDPLFSEEPFLTGDIPRENLSMKPLNKDVP